MVGGTVIDIVEVDPHKWWINTIDGYDLKLPLTPEQLQRRTCAVYCDPAGERVQVGDALWWQAGYCMWTPKIEPDGRSDVRLKKIGGSGVAHPHAPRCPACGCTIEFCQRHGGCESPVPKET